MIKPYTLDRENALNPSSKAKRIINDESSLLKQASKFKKSKNWDKAIESLRNAYSIAETHHIGKTISSLSRLPNYLYLSGDLKGAWEEYHKVADLHYCSWYRSKAHSVYAAKADAYTRLANMLFKENYKDQALAYAMSGYVASRGADWIQREFEKDNGIKVDRWNLTEGLKDEIQGYMEGSKASDKALVKNMVKKHLSGIPNVKPDIIQKEIYAYLGCGDPNFSEKVSK